MAERMAKADAERDTDRKDAPTTREDPAKLSGQIETMQTQVTELVRVMSERKDAPPTTPRPLWQTKAPTRPPLFQLKISTPRGT